MTTAKETSIKNPAITDVRYRPHRSKRLTFGLAALLSVLLAGCQIIITPPDDGVTRISAGEGAGQPVSITVAQGEPRRVEISVSQAQLRANDQLLVLTERPEGEVPGGVLRLSALQDGEPAVVSTSPDFFAAAEGVSQAQIEVQQAGQRRCNGPCIALPLSTVEDQRGARTAAFTLTSLAGEQRVTLYAFVAPFEDTGEPANDSLETARLVPAPSVGSSASASGALELVFDEDFYRSELAATQVSVSVPEAPLELSFDVYTEAGELLSSGNPADSSYTVPDNIPPQSLIARVYSASERAAFAVSSSYTVEFSAVVLLSPQPESSQPESPQPEAP